MISSYFITVHQSFSSGTRSQRIPSLLLSGAKTKEPISFFLYKDLFVVLHKVWDRKVVTIRRESLFLPTCYNGKLQQWLLTHHSFIGFTQFPLRRLTVKKGKFHPVKSFLSFQFLSWICLLCASSVWWTGGKLWPFLPVNHERRYFSIGAKLCNRCFQPYFTLPSCVKKFHSESQYFVS